MALLVLEDAEVDVGTPILIGRTQWRVVDRGPPLLLRSVVPGRKVKLLRRELAARLDDITALENEGTQEDDALIRVHCRACERLESALELELELDLDAESDTIEAVVVVEVPANVVVDLLDDEPDNHNPARHSVLYRRVGEKRVVAVARSDPLVARPRATLPPFELPAGFTGMDVATDNCCLLIPSTSLCVMAVMDLQGRLREMRPTPAPMWRLVLDPVTRCLFGLQNYPPVLWKFDCDGSSNVTCVSLSPRRSAFFGCLYFIALEAVVAVQSPGALELESNDGPGGSRVFRASNLEPMVCTTLNADGCEHFGQTWCGLTDGARTVHVEWTAELPECPFPDSYVFGGIEACGRWILSTKHGVVSCNGPNWRREAIPDMFDEASGFVCVQERVFALLRTRADKACRVVEVTSLVL